MKSLNKQVKTITTTNFLNLKTMKTNAMAIKTFTAYPIVF